MLEKKSSPVPLVPRQPNQLPIQGKAFRFAPSRGAVPDSSFWKVWAEGNEVYLSFRAPGGMHKISVHQSGQIHYRLSAKEKQDLAPLMRLGSEPWGHAIEIRFLLSNGSLAPIGQTESLRKQSAHLILVPDGFVLHANLLIGDSVIPNECPLPAEMFSGAQALWRARLRDGRLAALVVRVLAASDENLEKIRYIRHEMKVTATTSESLTGTKHLEIYNLHWSPIGGNVMLVVPLGEEAFRSDDETLTIEDSRKSLDCHYQAAPSEVAICAPDERPVVIVRTGQVDETFELAKGRPRSYIVGCMDFHLLQQNLVFGSSFTAAPCKLACPITLIGASPQTWNYSIAANFNGETMTVEVRQSIISLQKKNLSSLVEALADNETLLMSMPSESLKVSLTIENQNKSVELLGRFTFRNRS